MEKKVKKKKMGTPGNRRAAYHRPLHRQVDSPRPGAGKQKAEKVGQIPSQDLPGQKYAVERYAKCRRAWKYQEAYHAAAPTAAVSTKGTGLEKTSTQAKGNSSDTNAAALEPMADKAAGTTSTPVQARRAL